MSQAGDIFEARLLAQIGGERLSVGQHRPFRLDQPERVWLLLEGRVEVQAVPMRGDVPAGLPRHVLTAEPGDVLFALPTLPGAGPDGTDLVMRAVAVLGSEVHATDRSHVRGRELDISVVIWTERWIDLLAAALAEGEALPPATLLEADPDQKLAAGACLAGPSEGVVWARVRSGALRPVGADAAPVRQGAPPLPLTERSLAMATEASVVDGLLTPQAWLEGSLWPALDAWHDRVLAGLARRVMEEEARRAGQAADRIGAGAAAFAAQMERVAALLNARGPGDGPVPDPPPESLIPGETDPLAAALALVAEAAGLALRVPRATAARQDRLLAIARASGFHLRRVSLEGEWWRQEGEPMLGSLLAEDGTPRPVALLPAPGRGFLLHDPAASAGARRVTADLAARLAPDAHLPYRPFPAAVMTLPALLRFGLRGHEGEVRRIAFWGVLGGLVALVPAFSFGAIYGSVLPYADVEGLVALVLALAAGAFGAACFEVTRTLALLRLQSGMDVAIQAGLWTRLLALPLSFFRRHTTGDLVERVTGVFSVREALTRSAADAVLGLIFSLISFAALFWFSWELALVATVLSVVVIGLAAWSSRAQLGPQRELAQAAGRTQGLSVQLIGAIAKLRVAGAEPRAFARWAGLFAEQQRLGWQVRRITALQRVLMDTAPLVITGVLFGWISFVMLAREGRASDFGVGEYLSFYAALGQFIGALMGVVGAVSSMVAIEPVWRRAQPIVAAAPEAPPETARRADPGPITGDIEFRAVRFRYDGAAQAAIDGISFRVRPGEFVAFVGASGSGKSTLVRLLLGLETPEAGGVLVDGKPLQDLDLGLVRRQFGVVVQGARPPSGSLYEVIAGALQVGPAEVWDAATQAGLADDIRAMPMGMHTVLTDGAGTLSGGQRQRLMIARALVARPRVLVLDEATSALDNRTQAMVNAAVGRLNMTRIVIAHRLTTIAGAHRIHVLDQGRIVESGGFDELLRAGGAFAALARRQQV
jgi:NHLM bacteriocin system ABC transporter ATP-binding protein